MVIKKIIEKCSYEVLSRLLRNYEVDLLLIQDGTSIEKAIADYLQGDKDRVLHLDCLSDELYGAINPNLWSGCISEEQADYLREKYLYEPR